MPFFETDISSTYSVSLWHIYLPFFLCAPCDSIFLRGSAGGGRRSFAELLKGDAVPCRLFHCGVRGGDKMSSGTSLSNKHEDLCNFKSEMSSMGCLSNCLSTRPAEDTITFVIVLRGYYWFYGITPGTGGGAKNRHYGALRL